MRSTFIRIIHGVFIDDGSKRAIQDKWTCSTERWRDLSREWTGGIVFIPKTDGIETQFIVTTNGVTYVQWVNAFIVVAILGSRNFVNSIIVHDCRPGRDKRIHCDMVGCHEILYSKRLNNKSDIASNGVVVLCHWVVMMPDVFLIYNNDDVREICNFRRSRFDTRHMSYVISFYTVGLGVMATLVAFLVLPFFRVRRVCRVAFAFPFFLGWSCKFEVWRC